MWLRGHRATDLAGSTTTDAMGLVLMLLMLLRVRRGSRVHGVYSRAPIDSVPRSIEKGENSHALICTAAWGWFAVTCAALGASIVKTIYAGGRGRLLL